MRQRTAEAAGLLALLLIAVACGVLMAELAIRRALPSYDPSGHVRFHRAADGMVLGAPGAALRQIKNTGDYDVEVRFNAQGLRDAKLLDAARSDDLFVVGDSFAFGWGVGESERFSDRLQQSSGRAVFNIAMGSADLDTHHAAVRFAERNGAAVRKLVIAVTMENDLRRYTAGEPEAAASIGTSQPSIAWVKRTLAEYSAIYFAFTRAVHDGGWLRSAAIRLGLLQPNLDGIPEPEDRDGVLESSVDRIAGLALGREAVVLIVPSRRLWTGPTARRATASAVHARFVALLQASGLAIVDMRARMEAGGEPLSYHFANDGHWNAAGHRLAATALAAHFGF